MEEFTWIKPSEKTKLYNKLEMSYKNDSPELLKNFLSSGGIIPNNYLKRFLEFKSHELTEVLIKYNLLENLENDKLSDLVMNTIRFGRICNLELILENKNIRDKLVATKYQVIKEILKYYE